MIRARVAGLVLLTGCAAATRAPDGDGPQAPLVARAIDGKSGALVSAQELDRRLAAARVILVGEEHAEAAYHRVQRAVLERVSRLMPGRVALGVEWLPRSARLALEGFVHSESATLDELKKAVRWDEVWGHDFAAYAPLIAAAQRAKTPIVPLNAEPGLTRLISRGGIEAVPVERKAELPPLDSADPAHREWFRARMEAAARQHPGHAVSGEAFERYYLAQLVWDETMGQALVEAARTHVVVACAGLAHVERGLGIARQLGALERLVIVPVASLADARARVRDADMPEREADLFWIMD